MAHRGQTDRARFCRLLGQERTSVGLALKASVANDPQRTSARISCCRSEAGFQPLSKHSSEPLRCLVRSLGADMRRREFIAMLGGAAAVAWPLTARAQQAERLRRVGVLSGGSAGDPEIRARTAAFVQGLAQLGWTDGRSMRIDYRWGEGNADDIRKHAAELVALAPDVLLTPGGPALERLLQATRAVPIVFVITPTRSAPVSSRVCRGRAATPPALCSLNTICVRNGRSCSRKSRRA